MPEKLPHFGRTRHGLAVHERTRDHLAAPPGSGLPTRINAWIAVKISAGVGTMWCGYLFAAIALYGLPGALKPGGEGIVSWVAQTFLQLVLLSVIMVGQSVMGKASDARAAKTFEDAELAKDALTVVLDRLDTDTNGGVAAVLAEAKDARAEASAARAELGTLRDVVSAALARLTPQTVMAPAASSSAPVAPPPAAGSAGTSGAPVSTAPKARKS